MNKLSKFIRMFVLLLIILGIFYITKISLGSSFPYYGGGAPPHLDDPTILVMRSISTPPACPSGWTDGGTGSANYGSGTTNERYCY